MNQVLDDIDRAIKDIAAGLPVVVVDDANRENEGDIIAAASLATPELLAFMIRYTSGVICAPMRGAELEVLALARGSADIFEVPGEPDHTDQVELRSVP